MTAAGSAPARVLVLNGPNLNRLGTREPYVYGTGTLDDLRAELEGAAPEGTTLELRQTNDEAELIGWLHEAVDAGAAVILNPAAFTHYSYALRDAAALVTKAGLPLIEVHLRREQRGEQGTVLSQILDGLSQVVGMLEQLADGSVVSGPKALTQKKTRVRRIQQSLCVADQPEELCGADSYLPGDDVLVEQLTALEQAMGVDRSGARQVYQADRLMMGEDEPRVAVVSGFRRHDGVTAAAGAVWRLPAGCSTA